MRSVSEAARSIEIVLSGRGRALRLASTLGPAASTAPAPLASASAVSETRASASASLHTAPRAASQSRVRLPPALAALGSCSEARTSQKGTGTKRAIWSCRCAQNQSVGSWHGP